MVCRHIRMERKHPTSQRGYCHSHSHSWLLAAAFALMACQSMVVCDDNPGVPWPATDALGRALPLASEVGPPKSGRFVGIFYFLWHDGSGPSAQASPLGGAYDVTRILASDKDALLKADSPLWAKNGALHYWGEPLFGYYQSTDAWVLRRHAQMLADAGIDDLIFDTTNAVTYPDAYQALCLAFEQVRKAGGRTPQITFMLNTKAKETADELYHALYQKGRFPDLWFRWQGKPLMICDPDAVSDEVKKFFTLRRAHWPFQMVNTPYAWHWEAAYPQPYGFTSDPAKPEEVNVSAAQNLRASDGAVTNMSDMEARGRSFHQGQQAIVKGSVDYGYNFQEQWERALKLDPPFVMVTGWNEWTAGSWGLGGRKTIVFCDEFDQEFSRDLEPMKGGHADNYYLQLIANVRRYKGVPALPKSSPPQSIALTGEFSQWQSVHPDFTNLTGTVAPRETIGVGSTHYSNHSGRNDVAACKVACDTDNVYFYVRTVDPITPSTDPNWMWLLIDADQKSATGWSGYDFIVNRTVDADGRTWLEKNIGGWKWEKVVAVTFRMVGNQMQLAIPRSALGFAKGTDKVAFDFKWADNLQVPVDIMDFYVSGTVAPAGRFNFRYATQ